MFDFTDKIGNYKLEQDKFLSNSEVKCIDNKLPVIQNIEIKEHIVKNEYDNQELLDIMKDKNIFVKGLLPGVGKISACKNNKNTLFVSPYNKLCQDLRKDGHGAITLNRLLGQGIDDDMKIKKYDISSYDCIVFDEILLYNPRQLHSIKSFMGENKDKRFHYTGDIDRRKPFNFGCNNIENQNDYQSFCINQMFPNQITLRINKRLQSDEDKDRLTRIKIYSTSIKDLSIHSRNTA